MSEEARWYVVHTYSGYENKVKEDLEKAVENRGLEDLIQEVKYPTEEVVELKDNKRKTFLRKVFPGYVMVKMIMNDNTCREASPFPSRMKKSPPWESSAYPSSWISKWAKVSASSPVLWKTLSAPWKSWTPNVKRSSSPCPCSGAALLWNWTISKYKNSKARSAFAADLRSPARLSRIFSPRTYGLSGFKPGKVSKSAVHAAAF